MKVLLINSTCGTGSTGKICTDIAETLSKEGHECKIAYGRRGVPDKYKKYAVKIGSNFGVKAHAFLSRIFDSSGFHSTLATKRFIKWVKQYDPDVIHLHNVHGYYLNLKILFKYLKTCGKKIFWSLHDCWTFTGHCAHFENVNCFKWENACYKCQKKKTYPASILFDRSKKNYKLKKQLFTNVPNMTLIAGVDWTAKYIKRSFLKDYPVKTISYGINLSIFNPYESDFRVKNGLENKKIVLGVSDHWIKEKGVDVFIELAKRLDDSYKIVLVGTDDKVDKTLPKNILSIHRTANQIELAKIYSTADVFFNPTREDVFGLVNVESLACGTPVVMFNTGGAPESIDETCGIVVDKDDIDLAVDKIKLVCEERIFAKEDCIKRAKLFDKDEKALDIVKEY